MDASSDVIIVSPYGRGHWLAVDLATRGFSVTLAEVTSLMGRWTPDDWEVPFGFFHNEALEASQVKRLMEDAPQEPVDKGFCVWLKHGLIETKGPIYQYQFEQLGLSPETEEYLLSLNSREPSLARWKSVREQNFTQTWLAQLAHQLTANSYCDSVDSLDFGTGAPLFSEYKVRRLTREGFAKSIDWCKRSGVRVINNAKIQDLYVESKQIGGVEISGEKSGLYRAKYVVWCLSSEETHRLPDQVHRRLYPRGFVAPSWVWLRYRLIMQNDYFLNLLPLRFVMIENLNLPWTNSNMALVQRTVNKDHFDVWMRIPSAQRFQTGHLQGLGEEIVQLLKDRLPGADITVTNLPQDYHYDYTELGPSPFPVFSEDDLLALKRVKMKNLFYDGPEFWENLDWGGQFRFQETIRDEIVSQKKSEVRQNQ